ncbi:MAG: hypothetical protein HC811_13655, partial [Flammeovirgaceae bacterium]|nr:hypothetical protein [Flammeovirgaceae bacterium]
MRRTKTIINTLNKLVLLLVLSGSSWVCRAQFIIVPIERSELWSKEVVNARQQSLTAMPLPFWDDFSFSQTPFYPNDTLWENSNSVILSDGLGINLPSHKVGSFDGLDSVGRPYNVNDILAKGFADKLISRPLRLDLVDPSERTGVYLSFYFQYRGNGEPPDPGDQLILSFKGSDGVWYTVETYEDDESYMSDVFYQQVVQVSGDIYFHDDFQFRFQNKGRISGPYDTWNIDYIYLNKGRTLSDTSYPDRTISSSLTSPFSGYWAIPVRHYFVNPGAQVGTPSFEIYNLRVGNNQPLNYFSYSEI